MANLSKIDENMNAREVINILRKVEGITLFDPGGGHGQGWKIDSTETSGSIPLNSHGKKNYETAIRQLIKALKEAGMIDG